MNETESPTVISLLHVMMKCSCLLKANHCEYNINYASLYERDRITEGDLITTCNDEMQLLVESELPQRNCVGVINLNIASMVFR